MSLCRENPVHIYRGCCKNRAAYKREKREDVDKEDTPILKDGDAKPYYIFKTYLSRYSSCNSDCMWTHKHSNNTCFTVSSRVCTDGVWTAIMPSNQIKHLLTKQISIHQHHYPLSLSVSVWMNDTERHCHYIKKMFSPQLSWIYVLQPIITGFSRPMWVNPLLHKAGSNDCVFCCRWWV